MIMRAWTTAKKLSYKSIRPLVRAVGFDNLTFGKIGTGWRMQRLGTEYGGWTIPAELLGEGSICYCAGCGEDISFDLALIELFGCEVYGFDPTPRAIGYVERVAGGNHKYHFEQVGLWDEGVTLRFFIPRDPSHVSYSALNLQDSQSYLELPVETLSCIMARHGHTKIDLLKLDIEGAEYRVLDSIINEDIEVRILCVEYDEWFNPLDNKFDFRIRESIRKLNARGFEMAASDGRANYTFIMRSV